MLKTSSLSIYVMKTIDVPIKSALPKLSVLEPLLRGNCSFYHLFIICLCSLGFIALSEYIMACLGSAE